MAPRLPPDDRSGPDVVSVGRPLDDLAGDARRRRRNAATLVLGVVAAALVAVLHTVPHHAPVAAGPAGQVGRLGRAGRTGPGGTASPTPTQYPFVSTRHGDGALYGFGNRALARPHDLHVPSLGTGASPTWSPDGSRVAVISSGILVTDVATGSQHRIPCPSCGEIAWSPDGSRFAVTPVAGGSFGLVDASTGHLTPVLVPGLGAVLSLTWAPRSDELAFLANAGQGRSGIYTVRADGTRLTQVAGLDTTFPHGSPEATRPIAVRWSPTGRSLAVLTATPDPPSAAPPISLYQLRVVTMHTDGTAARSLVGDGRCICSPFTPGLAWSPDGRAIAVLAQHPRPSVVRKDGDGHRLRVRFVRGTGAVSWQPR